MALIYAAMLLTFLLIAELTLRHRMGLGNPVLFEARPSCGYRLKPNQNRIRFEGAHFRINNLGLRADRDWDADPSNKVLFLGDSVTYGGNRIDNEELFSAVAVRDLPGLVSGNAGVPGWGVENVAALVVDEGFMPASVYVTTFIEQDFYRTLQLGRGQPYVWFEPPGSALREGFVFALARAKIRLGLRQRQFGKLDDARRIELRNRAEGAVVRLKEMDDLINSTGREHLIYLSPELNQVLGVAGPDTVVARLLAKHEVEATYILDRLDLDHVDHEERASWFKDGVHLTPKGHVVWGRLIEEDLRRRLGEARSRESRRPSERDAPR
jgi:hypothetical protein